MSYDQSTTPTINVGKNITTMIGYQLMIKAV